MKKTNYKWIALSCTTLGAFFSVLSGSALMLALPDIMKELHTSMNIIMWIIMGYMLSLTVLVPAIGRVADMFGRKKLYVGGFALFTITSFFCGIAQTGMQLLIFRLIQSVGGALMVANSSAIVADAFPKNELGKALGINGMVISVASVIGPILGGFLVNIGWRSIFYVNIPIGIIGTLWALMQLKELNQYTEKQKFDWAGMFSFSAGMLMFLIALSFGGMYGWTSMYIISLFVGAIIFMSLFVVIENRVEQPMLDLRLFKNGLLATAFSSIFMNGLARGAVLFLLTFYFQGIKAVDPLMTGILLVPFALSQMIVSPISGWISDRYDARKLGFLGLLITTIGLIGFIRINAGTPTSTLIIWMLIMGIGSGLFFSPNAGLIMGAVPAHKRGIAGGTRIMMINAGSVISIGIAMAIISSSISPQAFLGLFIGTQVGSHGIAIGQFISGLRLAFLLSFIISALATLVSLYKGKKPEWKDEDTEILEAV
jgi:EmrB/QacA subfamily drug resistance transporter